MGDAKPGGNQVGKGQFGKIAAAGLDHQPDLRAGGGIEQAIVDQPAVHRRVEQPVVNDIVHMAVDVIVGPACRQAAEHFVVAAARDGPALAHRPALLEAAATSDPPPPESRLAAGAFGAGSVVTLTWTVMPRSSSAAPKKEPESGTAPLGSRATATRIRSRRPTRPLVGSNSTQPAAGR